MPETAESVPKIGVQSIPVLKEAEKAA